MFQVKRFKKLLQKADNDSCPVHSLPSSSIEFLQPTYVSGNTSSLLTIRKNKNCPNLLITQVTEIVGLHIPWSVHQIHSALSSRFNNK